MEVISKAVDRKRQHFVVGNVRSAGLRRLADPGEQSRAGRFVQIR